MFADVMIDLETLSTRPNAVILAIGAVGFNIGTLEIGPQWYTTISAESQDGLHISGSTVKWWMSQNESARKSVVSGRQIDLDMALLELRLWLHTECAPQNAVRIWGNGASFDPVILESAYRYSGIDLPWQFWNTRCFRTVRALYSAVEEPQREGTHHNALDDALHQVRHLIAIRQALKDRKQ